MRDSDIFANNSNVLYMMENRMVIKKIAEILKKILNNESLTTEEKSSYIKLLDEIMCDNISQTIF